LHKLTTLKHPIATAVGLAIALLATPLYLRIFRLFAGESRSNWHVLGRELGIWLCVAVLLWIVRQREGLPLTSIGLRADRPIRSLVRGALLALLVLAVTVSLYLILQRVSIRLGEDHGSSFHPSMWVVTLVMLRAGVTEEIFYRGYAIERLQSLSGSKMLAGLLTLTLFAAAHYRQGLGGIIAAFVLGGVFTAFYMKFRDLLANITAHFLGDFVPNVILPLVSGGG
jgi:CAAX protease family protein